MRRSSELGVAALGATLVAAGLLLAQTTLARAERAGPEVVHFTLKNGLEMVVIPSPRAPVVTHMIWYRVGAADEPPGKSGIAHFLEHLMFKGTEKYPAGRFSAALAAMGGRENAFTSQDYTAYFQRVPRERLADVMAYEADRMTGLILTEEAVRTELDVVLEEENQRVSGRPDAMFHQQMESALFLNHPYRIPVIGWRHEITSLTRQDALDFYRRHYGPNNAIVVIAGDVDPAVVRKLAEKTYGGVSLRPEIEPRRRPQEPPPAAARSLVFADSRVEEPRLQRIYLVPSYATAAKREAEALQVLAHILGAGINSRLYRELVVRQGLAVNAGAWYNGTALDSTTFGFTARPRENVTLLRLEQALDEFLAAFMRSEIAEDELDRAKTRLIADAAFAQDSQSSLARWYGFALVTGSTIADVAAWPERVRAVTADDVRAAAQKWLDKRRSVTGYMVRDDKREEERRS